MRHDLDSIFDAIPALHQPSSVTPLGGGITNHNYRVEAGGEVYVLRVAGANTSQLGIDRQREHDCAVIAAQIGIGAEVVAYLPEYTALVTRFVEGQVLAQSQALRNDVLARAAGAVRKLHDGQPIPGEFSAPRVIREYFRLARQAAVQLPDSLPAAVDEVEELASASARARATCACHNDLLAGNLIDNGSTIRIIDWEYAGMGNPLFDLGNFAENNQLSLAQEEVFLAAYGGSDTPVPLEELHRWRRISALREALWGFAQAGISSLDFDFLSYASHHLARFTDPQRGGPASGSAD